MSVKYSKICPKCRGKNINSGSMSLGQAGLMNGKDQEYCEDCGYGKYELNAIFPQVKI